MPHAGTRVVTALVFDGMKLLDLAGPMEVFAEATRFGAGYHLEVRSLDGRPVTSSTGMPVSAVGPADDAAGIDTLLVVGGDRFSGRPVPPELAAAAARLSRRAGRTASVCTGAFVLAAAGLLDGRRATTHWRHTALLAAAYPAVRVEPDALFVEDAGVHTSAGVSAGIDLALALVEQDHGDEQARSVAQSLVVFLQRPGGQSQFSPTLALPSPRTAVLRSLTESIAADPAAVHTVPALSGRAHLSGRHLARLFRRELGTTPGRYVESVRLDAAMRLLQRGHGVDATARQVGVGSLETLRRMFLARLGVSPSVYRSRFATAGRGTPC